MQLNFLIVLVTYGFVFNDCVIEAKSMEFSECIDFTLTVLRGGELQTGGRQGSGPIGVVQERIKSQLENLYGHITSLITVLRSLEQTDETLQEIEEMQADPNAIEQNILEYLGIYDIVTAAESTTPGSTTVTCQSDEYLCGNGVCIDGLWRCDGEQDCADGSDEADEICRSERCPGDFACDNGNCINPTYVCDGDNDCGDRSDENQQTCPYRHAGKNEEGTTESCRSDQFSCYNGFCINGDWKCDGEEDCIDGSDEADELCRPVRCLRHQFRCDNGKCIRASYRCDGDNDCGDMSDENEHTCPSQKSNKHLLHANHTSLRINHPKQASSYEDNEDYLWTVRNIDPQAVGFKVFFDKMEIEMCCDKLRIEGDYCSYGPIFLSQKKPTLKIEGRGLNVSWISDTSRTGPGFALNISLLYELNEKECYDYTCDNSGRCLRIHYDEELSWEDSVAACEAEGARLIVIQDQDMDNWISGMFHPAYTQPWIGISGHVHNMTWVNGQAQNYEHWDVDALKFDGRRCGSHYSHKWSTGRCELGRPYICEKVGGNGN